MVKKYISKTTVSYIFLLLYCFLSFFSKINAQKLSENAQISILTCDAGNELYSIYGHTAIRVQDSIQNFDLVYNYGYFDFRTSNFYLKFVKGDLKYFAGTDTFENFMAEYVYFQRGVYEQILNLNQVQKQTIFNELNAVLNSEKRFYTYKFIDRNCTTMVLDILNKNLTSKINTNIKDSKKTDRTILYNCIENLFYENLGINIVFGVKTDQKFNHIYLPLQLLEGIALSQNNNQKLCNETKILNIQNLQKSENSVWNSFLSFIMFFVLIVCFNTKPVQYFYFFLMGFLGIFLLWIGWYSNHMELQPNINVLLFNPLYFLLLFCIFTNKIDFIFKIIYTIAGCLLIYLVLMFNKVHFLMFLPIMITNAILLARLFLKTKKCKELNIAL